MDKFTNTIKNVSIIVALALLFVVTPKLVNADDCTYGPVQPGSSIWGCVGELDGDNNNDNDNDNNNDSLEVTTLSASSIDSDSATLRGEIESLDSDNDYERYFEWGTDEDDLDETLTVSGTTDNTGSFSRTLSGLSDDREYFYRACAEEDGGGEDDCGSIRSFTTDEENNNSNDNDNDNDNDNEGAIITTDASAIGFSTAILNGVVVNVSGSQTVWFEWGTTTGLGNTTPSRTVYDDQSMVSISLSGLSSNKSYYFRLASNTGERGDIKAFTTRASTGTTTTTTTTTTPPKPTTTISSDQYLDVNLVASMKDAKNGDTVMYQAVYQNLTNVALKNITVIVDLPEGIMIKNAELGTISGGRVELFVPTLAAKATESFAIETVVSTKSGDKFLVGIIEATYDHPAQENTRIEVIDYVTLKVLRGSTSSNSDMGANALFAGTFFPKGFIGWLILGGAIILLIILSRKLYKQKEEEKKQEEAVKPGLKIAK